MPIASPTSQDSASSAGPSAPSAETSAKLGEGATSLARLTNELRSAESESARRAWFLSEHAGDAEQLDAIESELGCAMASRVDVRVADPPGRFLHILGPVPHDSEAREAWKRGALILESHDLGAEVDPTRDAGPSVLGGQAEVAEIRAGLETLPFRTAVRDSRAMERDFDIGF